MPSLYRANVGLDGNSWEWHKRNPGRLSRLAQKAVHFEIALDALPDSVKDDCFEAVAAAFFDGMALNGAYGITNLDIVRHEATDEEMSLDAKALGVPVEKLLDVLQDLFDIELEAALRRKVVLRNARA
jgi:hypothetical protein